MNGEWIGNRWCQYGSNAERNRLVRKQALLLARMDASRSPQSIRLYCARRDAAEIVAGRIAELDDVRIAA